MLSQIVRPLVEAQVRLLANSTATASTLSETIAHWLGYLGVEAHVTQLYSQSSVINVTLSVGKPSCCAAVDWQKIVNALQDRQEFSPDKKTVDVSTLDRATLTELSRLLAYLIQMGNPDQDPAWQAIESQLSSLGFEPKLMAAIRSALKVPQSETLLQKLNPDIAAMAFPLAVKIALLDQEVNLAESQVLAALMGQIRLDKIT
jgi:hypothetical protein